MPAYVSMRKVGDNTYDALPVKVYVSPRPVPAFAAVLLIGRPPRAPNIAGFLKLYPSQPSRAVMPSWLVGLKFTFASTLCRSNV